MGRAAGLTLGVIPHNPRLPLPDGTTATSTSGLTASRACRPARSWRGSERWQM